MSRCARGGEARRVLTGAATTIASAGAAAAVWATQIERRAYGLRRYEMRVLAPGAAPVRALHLSDLHLAPWQADRVRFVQSLARFEPDLIIDTGDNVGHVGALPALREALEPFAGVPGVFVHGSNDYYGPVPKNPVVYLTGGRKHRPDTPPALDIDGMEQLFDRLGWRSLNNTAAAVEVAGQPMTFFGVDDPHIDLDSVPEAAAALAAVNASSPTPAARIGVVHAPYQRVLNEFVSLGADALFAGHTHGGQLCVPLYGALVTNCDIPRDQVKGLSLWPPVSGAVKLRSVGQVSRAGLPVHAVSGSAEDASRSVPLEISAGLGTSIYAPARFACRPEASLIELLPRDA